MPRPYTRVKQLEKKIFEMKEEGKTNREIANYFGFKLEQIKQLITRYNRAKRMTAAGGLPRRRGRPPKGYAPTKMEQENYLRQLKEKDKEIKRLLMENELYRDFLRLDGRR